MKLTVQKLVHGGSGVAEHEGKKIFVPFVLPGEEVEVEISKDHGSYAEAVLKKVRVPASKRVKPRCPVFGRCGGCQWQHMAYDEQLRWKRKIVVESLERIAKINNAVDLVRATIASPQEWHYRNRIQLHVRAEKVGFYRAKTNEIVEFEKCFIADERLNQQLAEQRTQLQKRDRGIALRLEDVPSFTQINTAQNECLKRILQELLKNIPHENVLELYCGAGNFSFDIAAAAQQLFAVDIDKRAIEIAKKRQNELKITNINFKSQSAAAFAAQFAEKCDIIVLDPPRKGAVDTLEAIIDLEPRAIIYISCDPATLSRDIKKLQAADFALEMTQPVDMFPQTFHVETVSLLRRLS